MSLDPKIKTDFPSVPITTAKKQLALLGPPSPQPFYQSIWLTLAQESHEIGGAPSSIQTDRDKVVRWCGRRGLNTERLNRRNNSLAYSVKECLKADGVMLLIDKAINLGKTPARALRRMVDGLQVTMVILL